VERAEHALGQDRIHPESAEANGLMERVNRTLWDDLKAEPPSKPPTAESGMNPIVARYNRKRLDSAGALAQRWKTGRVTWRQDSRNGVGNRPGPATVARRS
jgi:hypothetical protein